MGVREDQEWARKSVATVGWVIAALATVMFIVSLTDRDWARFTSDDGAGSFGLYRYSFSIANVTRSGRINTHDNTSLCSLDTYNASRKANCNAHSPCKDDCDAMIDACGICRSLTIATIILGTATAGFGMMSACRTDATNSRPTYDSNKWPRYSSVACVLASFAAVFGVLSAWAYWATLPSTANYFLKDFDTPGSHRMLSVGKNPSINIGAGLAMAVSCAAFVLTRNSKQVFSGLNYASMNDPLLDQEEDYYRPGDEFAQGTVSAGKDLHWNQAM